MFFTCHYQGKTPLKIGGCAKTINTMYKNAIIGISSLEKKFYTSYKAVTWLSACKKNYLQINTFSANNGRAKEKISNSINESY